MALHPPARDQLRRVLEQVGPQLVLPHLVAVVVPEKTGTTSLNGRSAWMCSGILRPILTWSSCRLKGKSKYSSAS